MARKRETPRDRASRRVHETDEEYAARVLEPEESAIRKHSATAAAATMAAGGLVGGALGGTAGALGSLISLPDTEGMRKIIAEKRGRIRQAQAEVRAARRQRGRKK